MIVDKHLHADGVSILSNSMSMLLENLYGDIVSDSRCRTCWRAEAACPERTWERAGAIFEPVHGSAPKIAGKNMAQPDRDAAFSGS